jgi:broad specificity phosphatase PhoE
MSVSSIGAIMRLVVLLLSAPLFVTSFIPLVSINAPKVASPTSSCISSAAVHRTNRICALSSNDLTEIRRVSEMPPPLPENLKNKYYLLRHGQSTANVAGVISSARSLAYSDKHGLTDLGYEQGKQSAEKLLDLLEQQDTQPGDTVLFVSSPFARARQTAQACLDGLAEDDTLQQRIKQLSLTISNEIVMEDRLMERFFGRLDDEAIYTYAYVWPLDGFDVTHTAFDVESVAAVCTRLSEVVDRFESEYANGNHHIVWVSHADVLQIAQLYGANAPNVGKFSSYRFKNGEVRAMQRGPDSLPPPEPLQPPKRGTQV